MVSFSLAIDSGRALSNWGSTPASRKRLTMASLIFTLAVPMRMGRPLRSLFSTISWKEPRLSSKPSEICGWKVYMIMIDVPKSNKQHKHHSTTTPQRWRSTWLPPFCTPRQDSLGAHWAEQWGRLCTGVHRSPGMRGDEITKVSASQTCQRSRQ